MAVVMIVVEMMVVVKMAVVMMVVEVMALFMMVKEVIWLLLVMYAGMEAAMSSMFQEFASCTFQLMVKVKVQVYAWMVSS